MNDIPALGYATSAIDRVAARRNDPEWIAARLADPLTRVIRFVADRPRIAVAGLTPTIAYETIEKAGPALDGTEPVLLGVDEGNRAIFALLSANDEGSEPEPGVKLIDLRSLAVQAALPASDLGLLAQARTLLHWHSRHRFCSNCGVPTRPADAGYRRTCEACRAEHFPRTDPVAIVLAVDGERCLLGRQPNFAPQVYSTLAGFLEPGETIEEAARREIFEEAGIRLGPVRYVKSQPWPFPANLMIGLIADALTTDITIETAELEDARWFEREEVRAMVAGRHPDGLKVPPPMAIAWHLVTTFLSSP